MKKFFSANVALVIFWVLVFCFGTSFYVFAQLWNEPSASPPLNNMNAPINISSVDQFKAGRIGAYASGVDPGYGLTVGGLGVKTTGDSYFEGDLTLARIGLNPSTRILTLAGTRADSVGNVGEIVFQNNDSGVDYASALITSRNYCGDRDGALYFYTARQGSLPSVPHLVVHCNGMIGIGTVSPAEKLHISGGNILVDVGEPAGGVGTAVFTLAGVQTAQGGKFGNVQFRSGNPQFTAADISGYYDGTSLGGLLFRTYNGALIDRMSINSSGAVRINAFSGSGIRMVVADASGILSTQAIPSGGGVEVDTLQTVTNRGNSTTKIVQIANATSDASPFLEFFRDSGSSSLPISLRFHQGGRWYTRIESQDGVFRFKTGDPASNAYVPIYASSFADGDNSNYYVDPNNTSRLNYGAYDNLYSYGWMQTPIFYDADDNGYYINPNGGSQFSTIYVNNWFRAQGGAGLYFQDYGGGWHMTDSTWIRNYNSKPVYLFAGDGGWGTPTLLLRSNSSIAAWSEIALQGGWDTTGEYMIGRGQQSLLSGRALTINVPSRSAFYGGAGEYPKIAFTSSGVVQLGWVESETGNWYMRGNVGIGASPTGDRLYASGKIYSTNDVEAAGFIKGIALQDTNTFYDSGYTNRLCSDAGKNYVYDCTGTPGDYAEYYGTTPGEVEPGDLISINEGGGLKVRLSSGEYDSMVVGVISTNPNEVIGDQKSIEYSNPTPVALQGRVPLKVSLENGPIKVGDPLVSSSTRGVAMKALKAGRIIGYALENYDGTWQLSPGADEVERDLYLQKVSIAHDKEKNIYTRHEGDTGITEEEAFKDYESFVPAPDPGVGKIVVFLNASWSDPDVYLTSTGELDVRQDKEGNYSLTDKGNDLISRIGAFAELAVAKIKAGVIETRKLMVDGVDILKRIQEQQKEIDQLKAEVKALETKTK